MNDPDLFLSPGASADGDQPEVIGISRDAGEGLNIPDVLPAIPTRGVVIFPGTVVPLTVRRPSTLKLIDEWIPKNKIVALLAQRDETLEHPTSDEVYHVGVIGTVIKLLRQGDQSMVLMLQAVRRFSVKQFVQTDPYFRVEVNLLGETRPPDSDPHWEATVRNLRDSAIRLISLNPEIPEQVRMLVLNINDPGYLADFIAGNLSMDLAQKQALLEETDIEKRVRTVQEKVAGQLEIAELQQKLQRDVEATFTETQRRAYLREQLRAIQRELGESDGGMEQGQQLRERLEKAELPEEIMEQAERELTRLNVVPPASPEFSVIVSYLETLADLPWKKMSEDNLDLEQARQTLDRDHYDLEKVKRRLIEYLAVRKLNPSGRGPILCFVGPPGVGKTSLGQSIADALGRRFSRMSLGGIRDEAEIRGHRRTYIGSMPGRIIQEMRRVGTRNPVMMLDEVDKLGADFRGDPASALLEVLDPWQNQAFVDRYLDVPFDLSQVIFIATANYLDPVPAPLRDRMEVIQLSGYTEREKLEIARRYLVRRQLKENGLKEEQCRWQEAALLRLIADYTREAGVRELERQIGGVCRAVAARVASGESEGIEVTPEAAAEILGPARYVREMRLRTGAPGVVTALAYTPSGGEVLHVEAARYPGKGNIILTGQIGNIMRESVQAAFSLVRTRSDRIGVPAEVFTQTDVHVHVPSGAVPKDGPSAGVAMFAAIASLFSGTPVSPDVAMTGEITLRGLVLPVGGLKEKSLAALQAGITRVIVPKLNEKDLPELPEELKGRIEFILADSVDEVLEAALEKPAVTA